MKTLKIAVSARALFDLEEANEIFLSKGEHAFVEHTKQMQDTPLSPGVAFRFVKALLDLNDLVKEGPPLVEVMVMTSFVPEAGVRILRSIAHHRLNIRKSSFTGNVPIVDYLEAFDVDLLLSRSATDAQEAVRRGIAAAIMYDMPKSDEGDAGDGQIRIAFDGDAVLFSDESERIYKRDKLPAFLEHEKLFAEVPMNEGPFANVLRSLHEIQKYTRNGKKVVRIAVVTARGGEACERVINTFDYWGVTVDEVHYLSGASKAALLRAFGPHIFFDDQDVHVKPASEVVPSGRVPWIKPLEEDGGKAA